jgi:tRNA (mo5U34)-methyltransferase
MYTTSPEAVGVHDVVLFAGVLYHLRHPLLGLEKVARVTGELLLLQTAMDAPYIPRPAMIMYPGRERNNDPGNWWGPNRLCVEAMLKDVGFPRITFTDLGKGGRGIFHAWRTS